MSKQLTIAIDSGKSITKGVSKINGSLHKMQFRTKVQRVNDLSIEMPLNSYLIDYENSTYIIGDMVGEEKTNYDISKHSYEHLLSIHLMTALFLEKCSLQNEGIPSVNVAINVPLNMFKNSKLKSEYEQFVLHDHKSVSLRVNNKPYIFRYSQVVTLPEATGSIYSHINEYRDKRVTVIDVGSLNVNFATFQHCVPLIDSMVISNQGINIMRAKLTDALTTKYGVSVSAEDGKQILKDGYLVVNGRKLDESRNIISDITTSHVKEIINFAKSNGVSFNNSSLLFCGGGSILLRNAILKELPSAIIDSEGVYSNAMSFIKVLEAKGLVI